MAMASRTVFSRVSPLVPRAEQVGPDIQKVKNLDLPMDKTVLQPRLATLRSYSGGQNSLIKSANSDNEVSRFFETLSDYIESSKKSQDFEIISGRLAMMIFVGTVSMEVVTGTSVFKKTDLQGIEEAAGVCFAAIVSAAIFALVSSNRNRVGRIFNIGCNTFIDSFIDQVVDGLFYESDSGDWTDEI